MNIHQISVFLENRSGQLAEPGGLLRIGGAPKLVALEKRLRAAK
jgi:hypothetical protein